MSDKSIINIPDSAIDLVKDIYADNVKPVTTESAKLVSRVPRAINAALASLDTWILQKEYNIEETKHLLASKLNGIDPKKIVSPEPYVAVPTIQALSYCMNSHELRNLYANLLAKSMVSDTKDEVHPSFVEIMKQLSPNDALVLTSIFARDSVLPAATLSIPLPTHGFHLVGAPQEERTSVDIITDITCHNLSENQIAISIDNLRRLGIILFHEIKLSDIALYDFVKLSKVYRDFLLLLAELTETYGEKTYIRINHKCFSLSPLGKTFCQVCISDNCVI